MRNYMCVMCIFVNFLKDDNLCDKLLIKIFTTVECFKEKRI